MSTAGLSTRPRRGHAGFTLIELLVVVIILGILSAVVVFAVRGADDKGQSNAIATDRRIIRTAMETYCAHKGTYPVDPPDVPAGSGRPDAMDVLVDEKFLSDRSGYHGLATGPKSAAYPEGRCADLGYKLTGPGSGGTQDPEDPTCRLADGSDVLVELGRWCMAATPMGRLLGGRQENLVQLAGTPAQCGQNCGRVLVLLKAVHDLPPVVVSGETSTSGFPSAIFDPTAGSQGQWTAGPVARVVAPTDTDTVSMLLLGGSPDQCFDRCGMVLAQFPGRHWKLYDPSAGQTGSWTDIEAPASAYPGLAPPMQLLGAGCAPHCGKVLIVGFSYSEAAYTGIHIPVAELYDPEENAFTDIGPWDLPNRNHFNGTLAELVDGRVLMVTTMSSPCCVAKARLLNLDAQLLAHEEIADPASNSSESWPATLPNNRGVLFVHPKVAQIFHLDADQPWETVSSCVENATQSCQGIAHLASGEVLVHRHQPNLTLTRLFTPGDAVGAGSWSDTRWPPNHPDGGSAVLLSATPCSPNCGRVLYVRPAFAELYSP